DRLSCSGDPDDGIRASCWPRCRAVGTKPGPPGGAGRGHRRAAGEARRASSAASGTNGRAVVATQGRCCGRGWSCAGRLGDQLGGPAGMAGISSCSCPRPGRDCCPGSPGACSGTTSTLPPGRRYAAGAGTARGRAGCWVATAASNGGRDRSRRRSGGRRSWPGADRGHLGHVRGAGVAGARNGPGVAAYRGGCGSVRGVRHDDGGDPAAARPRGPRRSPRPDRGGGQGGRCSYRAAADALLHAGVHADRDRTHGCFGPARRAVL
ncbi:MAG: hypothetical protein AVDCRST_MAG75-1970, partial [uncultured Propionibacteriaceae bacterium]